jgi:TRAP-type C4-dicarboxylate transport system permease small subunit
MPAGGPGVLDRAEAVLRQVVERFAIAAGWCLLGLSVLVTVEVLGRRFFDFSTQGADEIGGYVLAAVAGLGFSYALFENAHVRIELVLGRLSASAQAVLAVVTLAVMSSYCVFLAWQAGTVVAKSVAFHSRAPTPLQTPLVYPQAVWAVAMGLFALAALVLLIKSVRRAVRGSADAGSAPRQGVPR